MLRQTQAYSSILRFTTLDNCNGLAHGHSIETYLLFNISMINYKNAMKHMKKIQQKQINKQNPTHTCAGRKRSSIYNLIQHYLLGLREFETIKLKLVISLISKDYFRYLVHTNTVHTE